MRFLLLTCLVLFIAGCRESAVPKIELIIQDEFTGVVVLRWHQAQGLKPLLRESHYTLTIPQSGVLDIQGPNLMIDWHVLEARYAHGGAISQGNQHTRDENGIYLWDMGINANGSESWFVVGRIKDLDGVLERKMGLAPFPK